MKKFALLLTSALLISTSLFSEAASAIDAHALAQSILSKQKYSGAKAGSFTIVYGGQDISRGSLDLHSSSLDKTALVG
jgi:hypothetical protein